MYAEKTLEAMNVRKMITQRFSREIAIKNNYNASYLKQPLFQHDDYYICNDTIFTCSPACTDDLCTC